MFIEPHWIDKDLEIDFEDHDDKDICGITISYNDPIYLVGEGNDPSYGITVLGDHRLDRVKFVEYLEALAEYLKG